MAARALKRLVIGADHGGFDLKAELAARLKDVCAVMDVGAHEYRPDDDYPDFAEAVATEVSSGRADRGIIICGSGVGACVAAGKLPGVRAAVCHDTYSAHQGVEHDDMNVICLGARVIGSELAFEIAVKFIGATPSGEERHRRRLAKVLAIEKKYRREAGDRP
jgi:ribose 5-phosphate isomerase B